MAFIRSAAFLPIVLIYVFIEKDLNIKVDRDSIYPMLAGICIGLGIILSRLSLTYYEVSIVKPIQRLSLFVTVILSIFFLDENIDKIKALGMGSAVLAFFFLYPVDSELLNFNPGHLYLAALVFSLGMSMVFLRLGILKKGVNHTRLFRALLQTVLVFSAVFLVYGIVGLSIHLNSDMVYPVLNGAFGAFAFILFCRGLEGVGASTAKPMMVLATITTVILGILVLNESLYPAKVVGILLAVTAVILFSRSDAAE